MTVIGRIVPAVKWVPALTREDVTADLKAGATVAVLLIPQGMAYAALAGVPPIAGLYTAVVSLVVYAAFGTSRFISVGPVAIDSLLAAAAVAPLAQGDAVTYVALTSGLAVLVGLMQLGAGLLRLGALVNFLSVPVISGFTSGAALTIAATQIKDLFGLSLQGSTTTFIAAVQKLGPALPSWSPLTLGLGLAGIGLLLLLRRLAPRWPGPLLAVALLTATVWLADWGGTVAVLGDVPSGLPAPGLPQVGWGDVRALVPSAAAIALISFMESISTGTTFARRTRTKIQPDQELVALGLANAASGFAHGIPVAGGLSRGAVNFNAGARSQAAGVIASLLILTSLFTLTGLLAHLPKVALAAVILVAVISLIDVRGAMEIGRVRRSDLAALLATFVATLVFGPVPGLGVGVVVSLVLFLRHTVSPHIPLLGEVGHSGVYRNVLRHEVRLRPEVVIARVDAPLSFASARPIADRLAALVGEHPQARALLIDCSAINSCDYTGAEMLAGLTSELAAVGVDVHLAELRGPVQDILERTTSFRDAVARRRVHRNLPEAVAALHQQRSADG